MNSEFTNKLNRLRDLLSQHTSAQDILPAPGPGGVGPSTDQECPPEEVGACCQEFGCVDGTMEQDCIDGGGEYKGDGSQCADVECDGLMHERKDTSVTKLIRDHGRPEDENTGAPTQTPPQEFMG